MVARLRLLVEPAGADEVGVSKVLEGSPAARAGIQKDDVVVMINGWPVGGDINQANRRLRQTTAASVTVGRDGESKFVKLERKPVLVPLRWPR